MLASTASAQRRPLNSSTALYTVIAELSLKTPSGPPPPGGRPSGPFFGCAPIALFNQRIGRSPHPRSPPQTSCWSPPYHCHPRLPAHSIVSILLGLLQLKSPLPMEQQSFPGLYFWGSGSCYFISTHRYCSLSGLICKV